jgi:hypothetical protein
LHGCQGTTSRGVFGSRGMRRSRRSERALPETMRGLHLLWGIFIAFM